MIEPFLKSQLAPVARRHRRLHLWRRLAAAWAVTGVAGLAFIGMNLLTGWGSLFALPLLLIGFLIASLVIWRRSNVWEPDYRAVARQIEQQEPRLHALLVTAVEQVPDASGNYSYLQERVLREAAIESTKRTWIETVPANRIWLARAAAFMALLFFSATLTGLRPAEPGAGTLRSRVDKLTISPGSVDLEKGSALVVMARFGGTIPNEAMLVVQPQDGPEKRIALQRALNDPVFGGAVAEVAGDLSYHVEYAGRNSDKFQVKVFEHPRLEKADATISYPEYTTLPEKRIEDTRRVTAVEGSTVSLALQLNKPVRSARFLAKDQPPMALATATNAATAQLAGFALEKSGTYELQLVDADGRTNKLATWFVFEVLPNKPPELKWLAPRGDQRVSALEEMTFRAETSDDFGLLGYGFEFRMPDGRSKEIRLAGVAGEKPPLVAASREKKTMEEKLFLEDIKAEVDQLVSYFVWAEDFGPDGKVRRTMSDLFFAEVRPFEEIYRKGEGQDGQQQQQQQGQGQQGGQATKLADLQKQIINATWKLQRQAGNKSPTNNYAKDVAVVIESQKDALSQARELGSGNPDPRRQATAAAVETAMEKALLKLKEASSDAKPLPQALQAEQEAYQALLKLAAREFEVTRNRSRSQGQGQQNQQRNQQQLDQLEMKDDENRYETERQAAAPPQQTTEQQQALSRLKELAQRQQDVNERLKELQTALQEAKTEKEKEDLRRELKRLREEQREMVADLDELKQKMDQSQNQAQTAESREQLDKTREEMQNTAQALEQEAVSKALASGTRAQRDLQEMKEDFRKRNSSQFSDAMRDKREQARQLARTQEEINRKMEELSQPQKGRSLSDADEVKALAEQLTQQKTGVTNLLSDLTRITQEAEASEPLLSKQLYDTVRKASQANLTNALAATQTLVDRNFINEAGQYEQKAREGLNELKRGVEQAAESILGDDTAALRLAQKELDLLSSQVEKELLQAGAAARPGQTNAAGSRLGQVGERNQSRPGAGGTNQLAGGAGQSRERGTNQTAGGSPDGQLGQQPGERQGETASNQSQAGQQGQGQQPGQGQGQGQQPGAGQGQGQQPGQGQQAGGQGQQPGQGAGEAQTAQAQSQEGQQPGEGQGQGQGRGQQPGGQNGQGGQRGGQRQTASNDGRGGGGGDDGGRLGGILDRGNRGQDFGPITGTDGVQWAERLSSVEEMVDRPDLRNELARVRDRVRALRAEYNRHAELPKWDLVQMQVLQPLNEIRRQVSEELARRDTKDPLVPIDRDPVPAKFSELVRRYYETLGKDD